MGVGIPEKDIPSAAPLGIYDPHSPLRIYGPHWPALARGILWE